MRVVIYCFANSKSNLGHYFRCLALTQSLLERGHNVAWAGDRRPQLSRVSHYQCEYLKQADLVNVLRDRPTDWLIVDLPGPIPEWLVDLPGKPRLCIIDGVGQPEKDAVWDLVISQGLDERYEFRAPEYLMLRSELFDDKNFVADPLQWFVYGGASDSLGLLPRFQQEMPASKAWLVIGDKFNQALKTQGSQFVVTTPDPSVLFDWMRLSSRAVVGMGMTVWELLALKKPVYVFSLTERHLETSQEMLAKGWLAAAWPEVGLPEGTEEFKAFVQLPFYFEPCPLDGHGAARVVELLEGRR